MLKKVISDESGRALALTLIILGIGVLLLPTFLSHASTNLLAARATEEGLKQQYAADAGVEHAIFRMSTGEYNLGESFNTPTLVNNLPVSVTITTVAEDVYKIVSEAGDTRIESYISTDYSNLSWLLGNGITSDGDVTLQAGSVISGDVRYVDEASGSGTVAPGFKYEPDLTIVEQWPEVSELADFYWLDVWDLDPYPDASIDVGSGTEAEPYLLGPLYRDGDLLISSSQSDAVLKLTGTIYATGKLDISGSKDFTLDLNGQTIYVEYGGVGDAIYVGNQVTISGSGCMIAEGDIFFSPKIDTDAEGFVFVMSVNRTSKMNPAGSFYGAVAGEDVVVIQPHNRLAWTNPYDKGLNFPNGTKGIMEIVTYRIY